MGANEVFDWIIFVILAFLSVWFLSGRGKKILEVFDNGKQVRRKMSKEDEKKFLRLCGIFCVILAVSALMLGLFHHIPFVPLASIIIAIVDIIWFAVYASKKFPNNPRF